MDTKAWLTVNETLWYIPIHSGESFEIEYDIYIDKYQSNGGGLTVLQVPIEFFNINNEDDKNYVYGAVNPYSTYPKNSQWSFSALRWTPAIYKYGVDEMVDNEHHIKMVVNKINNTNFRVEFYIDGDLVGYKNGLGNLTHIGDKTPRGAINPVGLGGGKNVIFKMAIDNVRIKLPNGTVLFEDFEDNDWNRVFGWVSKDTIYGLGPAPNQFIRTPISWGVVILTYAIILFAISKMKLKVR
jgi:hypothetical protein